MERHTTPHGITELSAHIEEEIARASGLPTSVVVLAVTGDPDDDSDGGAMLVGVSMHPTHGDAVWRALETAAHALRDARAADLN